MKHVCLGALALVLGTTSVASAEDCNGLGSRIYDDPVKIAGAKDGQTTFLVKSQGSVTTLEPASMQETVWQQCNGLWTAQPDGSGAGNGVCYAVDAQGDSWTITWSVAGDQRTWKTIHGTGKFAGRAGSEGTFTPGDRFGDGLRINTWDGNCLQ